MLLEMVDLLYVSPNIFDDFVGVVCGLDTVESLFVQLVVFFYIVDTHEFHVFLHDCYICNGVYNIR